MTQDDYDQLVKNAAALAEEDRGLMKALIVRRYQRGLSAEEVANRVGISAEDLEKLEHYAANPRLSLLRRYALAVGAHVTHKVTDA